MHEAAHQGLTLLALFVRAAILNPSFTGGCHPRLFTFNPYGVNIPAPPTILSLLLWRSRRRSVRCQPRHNPTKTDIPRNQPGAVGTKLWWKRNISQQHRGAHYIPQMHTTLLRRLGYGVQTNYHLLYLPMFASCGGVAVHNMFSAANRIVPMALARAAGHPVGRSRRKNGVCSSEASFDVLACKAFPGQRANKALTFLPTFCVKTKSR